MNKYLINFLNTLQGWISTLQEKYEDKTSVALIPSMRETVANTAILLSSPPGGDKLAPNELHHSNALLLQSQAPVPLTDEQISLKRELDFALNNEKPAFLFESFEKECVLDDEQLSKFLQSVKLTTAVRYDDKALNFFRKHHEQRAFELIEHEVQSLASGDVEKLKIGVQRKRPTLEDEILATQRINGLAVIHNVLNSMPSIYIDRCDLDSYHRHNRVLKEMYDFLCLTRNDPYSEPWLGIKIKQFRIYSYSDMMKAHTSVHEKLSQSVLKDARIKNLYQPKNSSVAPVKNQVVSESIPHRPTSQLNPVLTSMKLEKIPLTAQNMISSIIKVSEAINLDLLSGEDRFYITQSLRENIPKIVGEYTALSPETRSRLKTEQGHTMDELLMESLSNIETKINNIQSSMEMQKVKDFKASHRYLTAQK